MTRDPSRSDTGAALVMALMLLAVLGTVTTVMFERTATLTDSSVTERARLRAFYAAEGGLAHARHTLADDPDHRGTMLQIGGCDVITTVTDVESLVRRWRVRAQAVCPTPGRPAVRCVLETVIRPSPSAPLPVVESWRER